MDEKYFAEKIEKKWQKRWAEDKTFETEADATKPKFYCLEMLPYPSGRLHMGHVRNYSIGDALAWYKRLQGFNVLHPIGWDSFGQPAEQAAIKKGVNPREWTEDNINQMREQLQRLGVSYDWRREIAAHRPEYYKFDQWFFLKMLEKNLAYKKMTKVNWCPRDETTLSNEQASGGVCWRCGTAVEKKDLAQWFLRITAYAEDLLEGMSQIEAGWAERVLTMQKNWIGKSEGAFVEFKLSEPPAVAGGSIVGGEVLSINENPPATAGGSDKIRVFTTRIDTIYGANAIVVAAEHPIIEANYSDLSDEVKAKIEEIKIEKAKPTDYGVEVEKDGIDTGLKAINPFSQEELPIWVGNYVMMEYGTGAVMSVPAHDERDFEFADKFNLPIKQVIIPKNKALNEKDILANIFSKDENINAKDENANAKDAEANAKDAEANAKDAEANAKDAEGYARDAEAHAKSNIIAQAFTDYGVLINSGEWSSKMTEVAKALMIKFAEENNFGEAATTYRLRDWGISRQRFWGAPIPIVYCETCGTVPVAYENLPVELPESAPFTGVGESPLARVPEFFNTNCPKCGEAAKRETDTMDTFVDSCWYYFRYTDPKNTELPFNSDVANYWMPVDQYVGGVDHAVMHLLYTRFWTKVSEELGLVNFNEPVKNLLTQGMVVGESYYSDEKASYVPQDEVKIVRDERGKVTEAKLKSDGTPIKVAIEKMSKSKYNGVDPDDMVLIYGADAVRIFSLFAAPAENELVWQETGIDGAVRFLQRVYRLIFKWVQGAGFRPLEAGFEIEGSRFDNQEFGYGIRGLGFIYKGAENKPPGSTKGKSKEVRKLRQKTHQTIKRITENFESFQFNTPVAALMELSNAIHDFKVNPSEANDEERFAFREAIGSLILMLTPYAPHFAEEMWEVLTENTEGILQSGGRFPILDESLAKADELEIPIQINGKLRSRILATPETSREDLEKMALADTKIKEYTDGKEIVKIIVVPNRLVNVVVK